ncbi:MAG TPA: tetratricopeptide repeat protein [Ktedonobacterales bacterium]|nr:tetratricopeptide repeat protein [Ktedonobacterales bacterium]
MNRIQYRTGPGGEAAGGGPLQRARLALANNQPAVTEDICRRRLEKRPDEASTRLLLAQALLQLQHPKEAVSEARRVVQAQPNFVDALLVLSAALTQSNQVNPPQEALDVAERAVQLQPKTGRTHVQLAEVLMMRKNFARSSEEADAAIRLEPRLAAAHLMKGLSLLNLKDYEGAAQACQAAIRNEKTMAPAYFALAQALAELKRTDEALDAVNTAQRMNPLVPGAQITQLRAQIYRKQRRYRDAYNEFLQANIQRTGKRTTFTPILAAIQFAMSFFGQNGPWVLFGVLAVLLLLILFGISKIPYAGGWLDDALLAGLLGFLGWNAVKLAAGGSSPLELMTNGRTLAYVVGSLLIALVVVFGAALLIARLTTPANHPLGWFNPVSLGFAAILSLGTAFSVLYFTTTQS